MSVQLATQNAGYAENARTEQQDAAGLWRLRGSRDSNNNEGVIVIVPVGMYYRQVFHAYVGAGRKVEDIEEATAKHRGISMIDAVLAETRV
jgi:hypothetical protein